MSSINSLPDSSNIKNNPNIQNNPSYFDPSLAESDYFDPSLIEEGISSQVTPASMLTAVTSDPFDVNSNIDGNNNIQTNVQSLQETNKHRSQMRRTEAANQAVQGQGS